MITVLAPSPSLDVTYLVDVVTLGEIHRPSRVLALAGGKSLNAARAAARLGGVVSTIAPLGGRTGEQVADLAAVDGLALTVVPAPGGTRRCVSVVADAGITEFYEPNAPGLPWPALRAALVAAPAGGWTALGGSVPPAVPVDELVDALAARRDAGDRIAVDSHGPALAALVDRLRPDLVKVNRAEAAELLGHDGDAIGLAAGIRSRTGGIAVVTDGAAGSALAAQDGAWRATSTASPGRYSVGSGDCFLAGLLVALDDGADPAAALAAAAAAGAANTSEPGAALFSADALDAAAAAVRIDAVQVVR